MGLAGDPLWIRDYLVFPGGAESALESNEVIEGEDANVRTITESPKWQGAHRKGGHSPNFQIGRSDEWEQRLIELVDVLAIDSIPTLSNCLVSILDLRLWKRHIPFLSWRHIMR